MKCYRFCSIALPAQHSMPVSHTAPSLLSYKWFALAHMHTITATPHKHQKSPTPHTPHHFTNGFTPLTSTRLMRCWRNSWASCCLFEENSGCPLLTRAFNIRGETPFCWCWNENIWASHALTVHDHSPVSEGDTRH